MTIDTVAEFNSHVTVDMEAEHLKMYLTFTACRIDLTDDQLP